jgi:hypothetical protein
MLDHQPDILEVPDPGLGMPKRKTLRMLLYKRPRVWPDESPAKLAELKRTGKATIHDTIWLSWVELFQEIGPQMTGGESH